MADVLILGYYGFGNVGDEAVLAALVDLLRRVRPDLRLAVLTADPAGTAAALPVTPVDRWRPAAVLGALRRSDLLLAGGGSLLQDATSLRSLLYYASLILTARACGKKVALFSNGLGPLRTAPGRALALAALRSAHYISLRDTLSLARLDAMAPRLATRAEVVPDPAFSLEPAPAAAADALSLLAAAGADPHRPFLAVCLRPWTRPPATAADLVPLLAAALDRVAEETEYGVLFLPLHRGSDAPLSRAVAAAMRRPAFVLDPAPPPRSLMAVLGQARAVVAMRLHAAILAAAQGVPSLGLAYDPKVEGVLGDLALPALAPAELTGETMADALLDLFRRRDELAARLTPTVAAYRRRAAAAAADLLRRLLPPP